MEGQPEDVALLLERIYDAAVDPDRWPAFLEALAAGYPGGQALLHWASDNEAGVLAGREDARSQAYDARYGAVNPWLPSVTAHPVGITTVVESLLHPSDLKRTEWYHDVLKPQGLDTGVGVTLVSEPSNLVAVCVLFSKPHDGSVDPAHVARLASCVPHLLRAIQVNRALAYTTLERRAAERALDHAGIGVIIATRQARVLSMNTVADRIVASQDGLWVRSGGALAAVNNATNASLRRAIREAALTSVGLGQRSGAAMPIVRPSGQRAYAALVAPLRAVPAVLGLAPCSALVLISDPELRQHVPRKTLQELHNLTPTQAQVAAALARGESPEQIAEALAVAVSTVRQHIKAILAKTGTHRQSNLVRLILSSAAAFAAEPEPAGTARRCPDDTRT